MSSKKKKKKPAPEEPAPAAAGVNVDAYGLDWLDLAPGKDFMPAIELRLTFDKHLQEMAPGFLGRPVHYRRAVDLIWNQPRRQHAIDQGLPYDLRRNDAFIWNEWSEDMSDLFLEWLWFSGVWSGNSAWKTTCAALYGVCAFYANPNETSVVLTTTSLPGLRKRIWKEVLKFHRWSGAGIGFEAPTDYAIRFRKGSDDGGIFGIATGQNEGDVNIAVNKIIGYHNRYVIAVVDEAQATNDAIVRACLSLEAGAERFQLIMLGNPDSELNMLGRMSTPKDGYSSITVDTGRWETTKGAVLHLDCYDCPRVKEGDAFYPGMLKQADIDSAIETYGADSPEFWQTRRGFIPPQGITKSVLTSALIRHHNARDPAVWKSDDAVWGAALDPAFEGGDRCTLRLGRCGEFQSGQTGIELGELHVIKLEVSKEPLEYQIVRQVRDFCEQHEPPIAPENFATDCTGTGRGVAAIFQRDWSPAISLVDFNGAASDQPISDIDPTPARQVYLYRVTELWYQFRLYVISDLIRGLDLETEKEFTQRLYDMRGMLKMVESKKVMKARTKRSPDFADATVVLCELFRRTRILGGGPNDNLQATDARWRQFKKDNDIYSQDDYLIDADAA